MKGFLIFVILGQLVYNHGFVVRLRDSLSLFAVHCSSGSNSESKTLKKALEQAKVNRDNLMSPGAGVDDAFEAADAAYADLILTSVDNRELELGDEDLKDLERGGTMWEDGAKDRVNSKKGGFVGDVFNALSALAGGAHIVKDKNGET
jgi:hypothetical protein